MNLELEAKVSSKFNIGDRVRHLDDSPSVPYGTLGTVVPPDEDSQWSGAHVLWDEYATDWFPPDYHWAAEDWELEAVL